MTTGKIIYQVALDVPLRRLFDYLGPDNQTNQLARGTRVRVPFGRQTLTGIILGHSHESAFELSQLKAIQTVCDDTPIFPDDLCSFIEKAALYYHHPIGEVAFCGAPSLLREGKEIITQENISASEVQSSDLILNDEQTCALEAILQARGQFKPFLLEGITGSGKTEIYLRAAQILSEQQHQILILVPEISLTPQTQQRFIEWFGSNVICYHSRMTPKARFAAWLKIQQGATSVIVGTRSSIFLPFTKLGLIVVDEEHDASFKQQEGFRYSARDMAVVRAKLSHCPVVLGSATPAFESLHNAQTGKYRHLVLSTRATKAQLPTMTHLDIRHNKLDGGLSAQLVARISDHLKAKGQVLLFINRRGFAPTYLCYGCGWIAECKRCDARLTYHQRKNALICHHCSYQSAIPKACPSCQSEDLNPIGQGTEKIEEILSKRFADTPIARIDSDATRKKGSLEALLEKAQKNEIPLLIGTQMLAKGHHFPHLTLVAIVDADGGLFSVDFRAVERMAQLLIQVAGRAGRVHQAGEVVIQTCFPAHPLLQQIREQNYPQLAESLLAERSHCRLPPFAHLALVRAHASNPQLPEQLLAQVQKELSSLQIKDVEILGPVPATMYRRQGNYRYQLLIQAQTRKPLHQVLSYSTSILEKSPLAKRLRWSLDVDPLEMF
ncbi:MAG: primosomal protein N' [Candidatus Berkiella sp.]